MTSFSVADDEDDDFFGLSRLFHLAEGFVDWRVRLLWVQTCMGTCFYVGENLIFKTDS